MVMPSAEDRKFGVRFPVVGLKEIMQNEELLLTPNLTENQTRNKHFSLYSYFFIYGVCRSMVGQMPVEHLMRVRFSPNSLFGS